MIKKIEIYKTIQLFIYVLIGIVSVAGFVVNREFSSEIGSNPSSAFLAKVFWGLIVLALVFVFLDFTLFMKANRQLDNLYNHFRSDKIAKVNNRNSVDAYIESFKGKEIPERMCCVLFTLHSLEITNVKHDRSEGDKHVRAFSNILGLAAVGNAFVGRNGGGDFLVFFSDAKEDVLRDFFFRIEALVSGHNEIYDKSWIRYRFGVAYNADRGYSNIGDLIHVAYERTKESEIVPDPDGKFKEYEG